MSKKSRRNRSSRSATAFVQRSAGTLQRAINLHQTGDLKRAQALYGEILWTEPQNFDALHLSGVIAAQNKNPSLAVELIGAALRSEGANPAAHAAHRNLGLALTELGRFEAALASFDNAIALHPGYAEAHLDRGMNLLRSQRFEAAVESCNRATALKPNYAEAYVCLGNAYHGLKRLDSALLSFERANIIDPRHVLAHSNRGAVLNDLGRSEAALASCEMAITLRPSYAEAYFNRGNALRNLKRLEAALASYDQGLELIPHSAEALSNRGALLHELGKLEAALASCERALAIAPDYAEAHSNRGMVLREMSRLDAALESHDRAIALRPDFAIAHANRGVALYDLHRLDEAIASFDRALQLDAGYANAHFHRSLCLLLNGDMAQGWAGFEWRNKSSQAKRAGVARQFERPRWTGKEPIDGKTLLLHSEQGLGDTIQFARYATLAARLGALVVLEVQSPLVELIGGLNGVTQVVCQGEPLPPYDYQCPLMSLPLALESISHGIPAEVPYLKANARKIDEWKVRLGEKTRRRVGLVWSGGFRLDQPELWAVNNRRNIPLQKLAGLAHPDIEFYSLQKGEPAVSELADLRGANWDGPDARDMSLLLDDFTDTAALMENLDLVVTVDTSTAHLAGAMGRPVWMLNRFDTCWRWLLDRDDTPWYPTMRLYRQPRPGDWEDVVCRVRTDLWQLANDGPC